MNKVLSRRTILKTLAILPCFAFLKLEQPWERKFGLKSMCFDGKDDYIIVGFEEPIDGFRISNSDIWQKNFTPPTEKISQWNGKEWIKI